MGAPRASWKGFLKLSLVSCPVRLYNATTDTNRLAFHLLHKDTHNRIRMQPQDPELGDVERSDLVKGYEYDKDQYIVLSDDDFASVRIESSETLTIDRFVDQAEVDELYLDQPYYLAPDGKMADETFRVIRDAMREKGKVALSRLVIGRRERLVMLYPRDKGLVCMTLRTADEVRGAEVYFKDIGEGEADAEMMALAGQLIDQKSGHFDAAAFTDRYEEAVRGLVQAKLAGTEPVIATAPERGKVVNLMDALRQSLERAAPPPPAEQAERRESAGKRSPRKTGATRPARQKQSA